MLKIGALEYKLLQIQNCIDKDERILNLINNKKITIDEAFFIVKKEFLECDCKIALMEEAVNRAIKDSQKKVLSEEEIIIINSYYKPLVRDFCPEINLKIPDEEKLLFEAIKDKYISGNITEIKKYEKFEKRELYFDELEGFKIEKRRLEKLIKRINDENISIKNMYPYTEKKVLLDENLYRRRKDALNKEIIEKKELLNDLEKQIDKLKK